MHLFEFLELLTNKVKVVDFLIDHGVLLPQITCDTCGSVIYLNKEALVYRCRKVRVKRIKKKKPVSIQCAFYKSARTGTWFARSHLDIITLCKLVACFLFFPSPRVEDTETELHLSRNTVVNWLKCCQEVCVLWAERNSQQLGGPGHIVELDEAKIGKCKYNRGCFAQKQWIFGGCERESTKVFIMPVKNLTAESLLACIQQWILPGTTIMSDCWKTYNCLNSESFQQLTANGSYNFIDPDIGTQHIEHVWRDVRGNIPRYGARSYHALKYLAEFFFKRAYIREELIEAFFDAIGQLYPPMSIAAVSPESTGEFGVDTE